MIIILSDVIKAQPYCNLYVTGSDSDLSDHSSFEFFGNFGQ